MTYEIQRRRVRSDTPLFPKYHRWIVWDRREGFVRFVKAFETEQGALKFVDGLPLFGNGVE